MQSKYKYKQQLIIATFIILFILFSLLKIYVIIKTSKFRDFNAQSIEKIKKIIGPRNDYSFIIVGNVKNSIDIFDKKLIPLINDSEADFVVFLGDEVIDGNNDKYGILYDTLLKLNKPAIVTVGDAEVSDGGDKNFFRHIGPSTFFFLAGKTEFIFMDTSGKTSEEWQQSWIQDLLRITANVTQRFIFMNRSLIHRDKKFVEFKNKYQLSDNYKNYLIQKFSDAGVSYVFSSNNGYYSLNKVGGVNYLSTGGGGGELIENDPDSFFHSVKVTLKSGKISTSFIKPDGGNLSPSLTLLEFLWFRLLSWVYVYYLNVLLIMSSIFLIIYFLYSKLNVRIDYYPDLSEKIDKTKPLKIAMFTNNYLPFIGGVPISISRLKKGLESKGHQVFIFAPQYDIKKNDKEEEGIFRCTPLFHYKKGDLILPVSNIFSSSIRKEFKKIKPDVVHVHHPFWLGSVGKQLARRFKLPVVFTYHTRLEQYNHYVPVFHQLAGGQIPHLIIKEFASACDAVIAPTKMAKCYIRNLGIGKLVITQATGIDMSLFTKADNQTHKSRDFFAKKDELILFSVFRLSKEKNPYFLLDGMKKLNELSQQPFKCFIAGTGPEEDNMKAYIKSHNLENNVFILGKVPPEEIPDYYKISDIFVFSSLSETQGMVILEAMAGGCPVVAVDSSGISDIVENDINGYKTEANLDKWVSKIQLLMENDKKRTTLGEQAFITASGNSINSMAANILDLYYEIISWKKKHPYQTFIR